MINTVNLLVFEDEVVTNLYPVTTGRPAFHVTIATRQLSDWLRLLDAPVSAVVRGHLRELLRTDHAWMTTPLDGAAPLTLIINGRLVPSQSTLATLRKLKQARSPVVVFNQEGIPGAAVLPTAEAQRLFGQKLEPRSIHAIRSATANLPVYDEKLETISFPHEIIRHHLHSFDENLGHRLENGSYREISDGVFIEGEVAISDFVVTNSHHGPILIDSGTVIGPFCFLRGPIHIGRDSRVNEHAAIKDSVSVGHTCKIGGEVEGSIIESYSNKQHHGFLGHSYLGSWINLGAGTCNSDLKNTYGEVKIEYRGERVNSGMQFVGCIMGDYSKTAINTSIFTGKTIGVCSMLYGFITTNVPSFSNYARTFGQVTESPPAIMELTQKRMFSRRNVQQRQIDIDLLQSMYELTRHERQMSEEPLNL